MRNKVIVLHKFFTSLDSTQILGTKSVYKILSSLHYVQILNIYTVNPLKVHGKFTESPLNTMLLASLAVKDGC